MNKRNFLAAAALGSAALPSMGQVLGGAARRAPALLTITGAIGKTNRGPLDPLRDLMMARQKIAFEKACGFDFASIAVLPSVTIRPTLEYDQKQHTLRGPLLTTVLNAVRASPDATSLAMRAVDGYSASISLADARKYRFIVATSMDGAPMPLGGLGPMWAVYEPDRFPDRAAMPLDQRFAMCPWALYHIDVQT